MGNRTFTMIKPDAVSAGHAADILKELTDRGFKIIALKMWCMSRNDASRFYAVHKDKPFFAGLVDFMTSGPIVAAVLEKDNAVAELRKAVGATNAQEAEIGTIRRTYGSSVQRNAIHASDSDENAAIEASIHFTDAEIMVM